MTIVLNSELRGDNNPGVLRVENKIPAVLYGPDIENQSLALDYNEFVGAYEETGGSSLLTLKTPDGKDFNILIGEIQKHPISSRYLHVDLRQVSMTQKIEAEAELSFVGEAPAVKELGGIFAPAKSVLLIKALPKDLVSEIEVDISVLATFGDKVTVRDIKLPSGVEVVDELDVMIAGVSEPKEEEEVAPTAEEEADALDSVEVEGGKKEGSEEASASSSAKATEDKEEKKEEKK